MHKDLTLVTALFDIGRSNIDPGFARSYEHYLNCFKDLLEVDLPMVIFCDEATENFVFKHRKRENTTVVRRTLDDLRRFPFYDRVQQIRSSESWRTRSGWIPGSPQASLELYNPLVMSKQFFLNDASIFNFFGTKYFAWIDAGITNTVNVKSYFNKTFVDKLIRQMNKMCYVAFPYDGTVEVHGFEKNAMNRYAGTKTEYVVRGGFFGGTRESIAEINDIYYSLLNDTLSEGLMGTEESLFTIISYRNPDKVNLNFIESNGLIYKFFEDVNAKAYDPVKDGDGSIAIYALTYNLPKQFEMWVNSFKAAYPEEFKRFKKYVVNNSTDPSVEAEYRRLFSENDFEEFKFDNIGINDARHEVAKHFDRSTHEYMVFFEDDMLLHHNGGQKSKLGFPTYYPKVFDICTEIIKYENLDYLKLSFDEFYGNNLENWGWYNLPEDKRQQYFPDNNKKTKVHHLGSFKAVPYAVGEYHYCNWPIMFTKQGNRKVFLEVEYASKFEQTWMSMVCTMQKEGKILAGSLLASIINHNRVYHYPKEARKENKYQ